MRDANRKYLADIQDGGICDTPLGLYMVAAGRIDEMTLGNDWAIYRQIFYTEISETEYNQLFPDFSMQHSASEYWNSLYRVSEEIAWHIYQNHNKNLLVPDKEIKRIISELNLPEDERSVVERCYALCGYWKTNTKRGFVEFYHNNIRDFFLCEKMMRELNRAYEEYGKLFQDERGDITPFLNRLCELFQYDNLESKVLHFLGQRAAYLKKDEPDLCVESEKERHNTIPIFENLLFRGDPYSVCHAQMEKDNPMEIVARILRNTVGVYRFLYESFLENKELIHWWTNIEKVNESKIFHWIPGEILHFAGFSNLRCASLNRSSFHDMDLRKADLSNSYLNYASFHNIDLRGADLSNSNLNYASFHNVNLRDANLCNCKLNYASFHNVNLRDADLRYSYLNYAIFDEADLSCVNLSNANLDCTDFSKSDLSGAKRDGYNMDEIIKTPIGDETKPENK